MQPSECFLDSNEIGDGLRRVLVIAHRVDDGHLILHRERSHLFHRLVRSDHQQVEVASQHARRVFDRFARVGLQIVWSIGDDFGAEFYRADAERRACSRGGASEVDAGDLPFERLVGKPAAGREFQRLVHQPR